MVIFPTVVKRGNYKRVQEFIMKLRHTRDISRIRE
jgi:hypothetical protein